MKKNMCVYEIKIKVYIQTFITQEQCSMEISKFIDSALLQGDHLKEYHKKYCYKNYCFDHLYPLEPDGIYKEGVYSFRIRTTNKELVDFFANTLVNHYTKDMKALTSDIKIIPQKHIEKVFSITPVIVKLENGYWRKNISLDEYERLLIENLIKKYNDLMDTKIDEDFRLYNMINFDNRVPISVPYKNIKLLGDKITLMAADNEMAQDLLYMSLGTGIGHNNARGSGFLNFRYL